MLLLSKKEIKEIFSMKEAIEACKFAFQTFSSGKSMIPLRTNLEIVKYNGTTLFMPGYVEDFDIAGIKIVSVFPDNPSKGKPSVPATMILIDETTGEVCCILDGTYLTQLRTGAASGAATDVLARKNSKIGALIGTGGQAICQLESMLTVRQLEEVRIFSRNFERAKSFVKKAQIDLNYFGTSFLVSKSSDDAIKDADIITAVTTSKQPVFDGSLVKAGAHINGVGSFMPDMQELDEEIIRRANKIYFDSQEAVLSESGDFITPLKKNKIDKNNFIGDLGEVINGDLKGRKFDKEITLFKTVGLAVQDIVTGTMIYKKALKNKVGQNYYFK